MALSDNQIRLRMRSLVGPMSGEIERAADQIIAGTSDPAVKRPRSSSKNRGRAGAARSLVRARPNQRRG